jgi:hypothetical protein
VLKERPDFRRQLPVQLATPATHLDAELTATPVESPPAGLAQSVSELVTHWAPAMSHQPPPVKLWENSERLVIQWLQETVTLETAKSEMPSDRERLARFAAARLAKLPVEHLLAKAMKLLPETVRRERANRRFLEED